MIHACNRLFLSKLFSCEACRFTGTLMEAIAHVVRHQFVVPR